MLDRTAGRSRQKIRVLVVDDSAVVRQALSDIINSDPELEVIGVASDPFVAAQRMRAEKPDVITLDVEMPRMDGVTFLRKIMQQHPMPVVMCSSLVGSDTDTLAEVLAAGAAEVICKPKLGVKAFIEESRTIVCDAIKAAAVAKLGRLKPMAVQRKLTADAVLAAPPAGKAMTRTTDKVIVIGASTGGTQALAEVLAALPLDCPPVVVVQHMPAGFTAAFAKRLDGLCQVSVSEARNGDRLLRGHVLIAPGDKHLLVSRSGAAYGVEVRDGPLVSRHRPSVDVLFRSVARYAGANAVGVIMTGMGDDGALGLKEMRDAGARTLGQDEPTCVVYGMPRAAYELGAVERQLPLDGIAAQAVKLGMG